MSITPSREGLDKVLTNIGRASTPSVPSNPTGVSLDRLLRITPRSLDDVQIYGVLSSKLQRYLESHKISTQPALPGLSHELITDSFSGIIVIDRGAFQEGAWFSTVEEMGARLREEVYELCRKSRTNGIPVWFIDSSETDNYPVKRIKSACDAVLPYVNNEDFEEGAPVNAEFEYLNLYATGSLEGTI